MAQYSEYRWSDDESWTHGYLAPVVSSLLSNKPSRTILDIGCGNGAMAHYLAMQGHSVYGIDASESGIEVAESRMPGHFFVQDIDSRALPAPLQEVRFDTVISTEVIEHLYAPRVYMALIRLALIGGGEVVISTPYHGYLKNLALAVTGRMDAHFTALWDGGHIKFWSRKTLTALLEESGFVITDFRGAARLPWLWKSMVMKASFTGQMR